MAKKKQEVEKIKVLVVFRDKERSEADIFMQDGGVASVYHNTENLVTDYYQDRIEKKLTPKRFDELWDTLADGKSYYNYWPEDKEEVDDEVIQDAAEWLYLATNEYEYEVEKIYADDYSEKQLIKKINSILVLEEVV